MKFFLNTLKTKKSLNILKKYRKLTFIVNKKKINKIKLKEYFLKNYFLKVKKINLIKKKDKKKIIVTFKIKKKPIKKISNEKIEKEK